MMETRNAYELAILAECASPDTLTSAGAKFLEHVQAAVQEELRYCEPGCGIDNDDVAFEIADNAPNIYTNQLWQEFTDLAAWQEDLEEWDSIEDMEQGARVALYQIALRLATALFAEAADEEEGTDDE